MRIADASGLRLYDVHLGQGSSTTLHLPRSSGDGLVLQQALAEGWTSFEFPTGRVLDLTSTLPPAAEAKSRGASASLGDFFSLSFDQHQVDSWQAKEDREQDTAALGVSLASVARVEFFLRTAAERDRAQRWTMLATGGATFLGGMAALGGGLLLRNPSDLNGARTTVLTMGAGGAIAAEGLLFTVLGFIQSPWENQHQAFAQLIAKSESALAIRAVDDFLQARAKGYKAQRITGRVVSAFGVAVGIALFSLPFFAKASGESFSSDSTTFLIVGGAIEFALSGALFISSFWSRLPEEDLAEVIREERKGNPSPSVQVGIVPQPGGAALTFGGQF
jgi:hypothetical protein